ncbi:MAG: AbrB/MazE/SpoVT family DNA-binding domain-containing protein [Candidatus Bathyarchaeia archaeon]
MSVTTLDVKGRVLLNKRVRDISGIKKKDRLVAMPFKGGVILISLGSKTFKDSLRGFNYKEEEHEASKYLFGRRE